jgi:hypothetical protein
MPIGLVAGVLKRRFRGQIARRFNALSKTLLLRANLSYSSLDQFEVRATLIGLTCSKYVLRRDKNDRREELILVLDILISKTRRIDMDLEGAAYLYALAASAIAFIGFSSIVIIIRQTLGAGLSPFHLLLMQFLVEHGFVAFFLSLLPMLLALFPVEHVIIWRVCSGVATSVVSIWLIYYLLVRYPRVRTKPQPLYVKINISIQTLVCLSLLANAIFFIRGFQSGIYSLGTTWLLFQGADIFLLSLKAFLRVPTKE